jgi:predicted RNase H-like nuclease
VLDFARVAVLFVLQQETLDSAETAQTSLQHFFTLSSSTIHAAQNLSLGNGNTVDLLDLSIDLGNGSVGAANATATKRSLTGQRSIKLWSVPA